MSWSADDFFAAFADTGMLVEAVYHAPGGDVPGIQVGFAQPDMLIMNDMVQSTDYAIEYQTADMLGLAMGQTLTIAGNVYKVRRNPEMKGDGTFSHVLLTKL